VTGLPTVVLATGNRHKADEIRILLADVPVTILSLVDLDLALEVEESGETYAANALLKARTVAAAAGRPAMADDSGLEVAALDGAPGVRSSRFAGPDATDRENNALLLRTMTDIPDPHRTARFVCTAVLVGPRTPEGQEIVCTGEWSGAIAHDLRGESGFGYDPLFIIPGEGRTVAELGPEYKRRHSHRARAFLALAPYLEALSRRREELH